MTKIVCLIVTLTFIATIAGCGIVVTRLADYGSTRETTKQTQIRADADVSIAQINANAAVDVAQINADATRDTSLAYLAHRVFTAVLWVLVALWAVVMLAVLNRWGVQR